MNQMKAEWPMHQWLTLEAICISQQNKCFVIKLSKESLHFKNFVNEQWNKCWPSYMKGKIYSLDERCIAFQSSWGNRTILIDQKLHVYFSEWIIRQYMYTHCYFDASTAQTWRVTWVHGISIKVEGQVHFFCLNSHAFVKLIHLLENYTMLTFDLGSSVGGKEVSEWY